MRPILFGVVPLKQAAKPGALFAAASPLLKLHPRPWQRPTAPAGTASGKGRQSYPPLFAACSQHPVSGAPLRPCPRPCGSAVPSVLRPALPRRSSPQRATPAQHHVPAAALPCKPEPAAPRRSSVISPLRALSLALPPAVASAPSRPAPSVLHDKIAFALFRQAMVSLLPYVRERTVRPRLRPCGRSDRIAG